MRDATDDMRHLGWYGVGGLLLAASLAACSAQSPGVGSSVAVNVAQGSVPITVVRTPGDGLHPFVTIQVGTTAAIRVSLDTGSMGLQLFGLPGWHDPGSGVRCTEQTEFVEYGNPPHIRYSGRVCTAYVTIGGVRTVEPVPFGMVTAETCPVSPVSCTRAELGDDLAAHVYGVLGIALGSQRRLVNPLLAMSGGEGARYSISLSSGGGTLDLVVPAATSGAVFHLRRLGNGALGLPLFDKSPLACLIVDGRPLKCIPTLFDTGAWWPKIYGDIPGLPLSGDMVTRGTVIGFAVPGSDSVADSVTAQSGSESPIGWIGSIASHVNASIEAFFGKVLTFDPDAGTITIATHS